MECILIIPKPEYAILIIVFHPDYFKILTILIQTIDYPKILTILIKIPPQIPRLAVSFQHPRESVPV